MQRKSERLFRIYQRLKTVPQTIDELFRWSNHVDLGIGRRTLYRYLEELESSIHEPGYEVIITNHETAQTHIQTRRVLNFALVTATVPPSTPT